jgi:hypothetical protein
MKPATIFRLERKPAPPQGTVTRPHWPRERTLCCLDCDSIFEASGEQKCPACGSAHAWAIGRATSERRAG